MQDLPSNKRRAQQVNGRRARKHASRCVRREKAQSLVETMVAFFILIPIGLIGIDLTVLFSSTQQNEQLAEQATRAAASQGSQDAARLAAQGALDRFTPSGITTSVTLQDLKYDLTAGTVSVSTEMTVKLPVPFPYFSQAIVSASSVHPLVSIPAPG